MLRRRTTDRAAGYDGRPPALVAPWFGVVTGATIRPRHSVSQDVPGQSGAAC